MTDPELESEFKNVNERIAAFGPEDKLNRKEWRQLIQAKKEKEILEEIRKAREKGDSLRESKNETLLVMTREESRMNPVMRHLMQIKLRSHIWG